MAVKLDVIELVDECLDVAKRCIVITFDNSL